MFISKRRRTRQKEYSIVWSMAQDPADVKSRFETLSRGAYLDVLLPKASDFNASALIQSGSPEELARAPSRRNLFFGK